MWRRLQAVVAGREPRVERQPVGAGAIPMRDRQDSLGDRALRTVDPLRAPHTLPTMLDPALLTEHNQRRRRRDRIGVRDRGASLALRLPALRPRMERRMA